MGTITSSAKQQAVDLAKQIAKDISNEPGEILKDTREQLTGIEPQVAPPAETPQISEEEKQSMQIQSQRQIQALENEIKDIQIQKERQEVMEERQEEAHQIEEQRAEVPMMQSSSKPGRRMGMMGKAKQQQTRIEKPLPPTG